MKSSVAVETLTMTDSNKNPKVLIAAGTGHITEVEMIKGLHNQGINIHAAFNSTSPHLNTLREAGVPTRTLDLKSNADFSSVMQIRRWIKNEGFDILHGLANRQVANFIWASYGQPNKLIAYRGAIGHVSRWDPTCYIKWLNPRIDKIVCVSNAVYQDLKNNGVNKHKLITIYKGHDTDWYRNYPRAPSRARLLELLGLPEDAFIVGMAANMRHIKGADLLLRALIKLPKHVHGVLIGNVRDPSLKKLAANAEIAPRVHFIGYTDEAQSLVAGFDLNCAPSRGREGLTKSVIEAMALKIPSVVSEAGGLPELIQDGENGCVVPIGDPDALASAINYVVLHPDQAQQWSEAGLKRLQEIFNIRKTVERTRKLYSGMLCAS
jgi:glycosyltransferase involved in cell wall biosynthesis